MLGIGRNSLTLILPKPILSTCFNFLIVQPPLFLYILMKFAAGNEKNKFKLAEKDPGI